MSLGGPYRVVIAPGQFTVHAHLSSTAKFVVAVTRKVREKRR